MGLRSLGGLRRKDSSLRWERTSGKTALAGHGAGGGTSSVLTSWRIGVLETHSE